MFTSKNIRYLRRLKDVTQQELAKAIDASDRTVSTWELGIKEPRMGKVAAIAEYFGISVSDLMFKDFSITENTPAAEATGVSEEDELMSIIKDLPEQDLQKVADYIDFLKSKRSD